jgi:hypothetical protein
MHAKHNNQCYHYANEIDFGFIGQKKKCRANANKFRMLSIFLCGPIISAMCGKIIAERKKS